MLDKNVPGETTNRCRYDNKEENPDEFEVPSDVVTETEFLIVDSQLNSGDDRFVDNIELNNGFLQLTTDDNPKEVVAQIPLSDLKQALQ